MSPYCSEAGRLMERARQSPTATGAGMHRRHWQTPSTAFDTPTSIAHTFTYDSKPPAKVADFTSVITVLKCGDLATRRADAPEKPLKVIGDDA
jgi:hypothetical protein